MANVVNVPANVSTGEPCIVARGKALVAGELGHAYRLTSTGWTPADASTAQGNSGLVGIVVAASRKESTFAAGETVAIAIFGVVNGFSSLTVGETLYTSDDAGEIADAAGTSSRMLGYCQSDTQIFVIQASFAY
jgi:hypothetical protein